MRISDWSSDVCSSDLLACGAEASSQGARRRAECHHRGIALVSGDVALQGMGLADAEAAADHGEQAFRVALSQGVRDLFMRRSRDHTRRARLGPELDDVARSEEHTSELQSLMRISYAVFCLKKKKNIAIHKY